ncbi:MAG: NAD-dependent epimerase/dehydratase family protein [Candidatus Sulfopaludibacter sp.]|nr:NAD-dependent epimerase/dehydratase family protein [Candidatus Sulfopaludibacter sp.]
MASLEMRRVSDLAHILITGAAGFIGSHLTDRLLQEGHTVSGVDNFTRGRRENLCSALQHRTFHLVENDLSTEAGCIDAFTAACRIAPIDSVWHLAANSDVQAGVADPSIDLRDTFLTTFHVVGAMRRFGARAIVFASSSAIYGVHNGPLAEDSGPLFPISNYGAMKLASEGIISAATESFLSSAYVMRFPNVVGGRATHGVIFDFIEKLRRSPSVLDVLGDGNQQKPYLHVSELVDAMIFITDHSRERVNCFNISVCDEGATVRSIAETVVRLIAPGTPIGYEANERGWVGDVPSFRYTIDRLSALGWRAKLSSMKAVERATIECHAQKGACSS